MKLAKLGLFIVPLLIVACSLVDNSKVQTEVEKQINTEDGKSSEDKNETATQQNTAVEPESDIIATVLPDQPILPTIVKAQEELSEPERFGRFVVALKAKAKQQGISQPVIDKAFANVTLLKRVISADKNQLEKKITLDDYLMRVLTTRRVVQAKEMYKSNAQQLAKASATYHVPANYIVALWGMESNFGRLQGKEYIISAMASLAFEGRREEFFTNELMAALQILQDGHVDIDNLLGSWAGAMGQCQFMPSSFIKYGADGDGDGKIDIWNNTADVFASVANYLATEGWDPNQRWGSEVSLPAGFNRDLTGLESDKARTVVEWQKLGVVINTVDKDSPPSAWIILPDDAEGRAFIVYSNFKTLMHWNRSYYFAISVGMLADGVSG